MNPPALATRLSAIVADAERQLHDAGNLDAWRAVSASLLGKRSMLAELNSELGRLDADDRREAGARINKARMELNALAATRREQLIDEDRRRRAQAERTDLTEAVLAPFAPGQPWPTRGHLNLVTQTRDELEDTFVALGFSVAEGPEAETDWYNFEALNMPPDHPARGMWDTLYLKSDGPETVVLRTHTSPVQVRLMERHVLPIYSVMPGRCYRRDTPDARHLPVFHQIEGLVVDRGISFGDLSGTIEAFTSAYFGANIHSRLRPSYFPFTEPSAEFDVTCPICAGTGCRTCSGSGWIELGGCGMVDPNVFLAVGIDPEEYSGFAFGFGIDRLAQVRAGLADMRILLDNDLRFLAQY
ncbi:MAG: phenylalanine--tRNA ligase subunit alpha [Actinomycetota bacterium]|nr:phenylalanine--tRNA ligase subunit alpha [Actinomycetota bacterium]